MVSWKRFVGVVIVTAILGAGYWYYLVISYESDLGTDNTYSAIDDVSLPSNGTEDSLFSLEFDSGTDDLDWAFTTVMLNDGSVDYGCTASGLTSVIQQETKVETKLNADGQTFTLQIDATSEDSYTHLNLSNMRESNDSSFSIRFSKTDIFLGENTLAMAIDGVEFSSLTSTPDENYTENSDEKLEWYDYDLTTHRIEAKDRIYVVNENQITYKFQILNYYNEDDESRHITMMVAWLDGNPIPAFNDASLVQESPCIILDDDGKWVHNESVQIRENGIDICNSICTLDIAITYEDIAVKGTSTVEVE